MDIRNENTEEMKNLMHNIAWLRKKHGLSKKKMAVILKIGVGTLNKIERGECPPNLGTHVLYNAYAYFGIRPSEMFVRMEG